MTKNTATQTLSTIGTTQCVESNDWTNTIQSPQYRKTNWETPVYEQRNGMSAVLRWSPVENPNSLQKVSFDEVGYQWPILNAWEKASKGMLVNEEGTLFLTTTLEGLMHPYSVGPVGYCWLGQYGLPTAIRGTIDGEEYVKTIEILNPRNVPVTADTCVRLWKEGDKILVGYNKPDEKPYYLQFLIMYMRLFLGFAKPMNVRLETGGWTIRRAYDLANNAPTTPEGWVRFVSERYARKGRQEGGGRKMHAAIVEHEHAAQNGLPYEVHTAVMDRRGNMVDVAKIKPGTRLALVDPKSTTVVRYPWTMKNDSKIIDAFCKLAADNGWVLMGLNPITSELSDLS